MSAVNRGINSNNLPHYIVNFIAYIILRIHLGSGINQQRHSISNFVMSVPNEALAKVSRAVAAAAAAAYMRIQ